METPTTEEAGIIPEQSCEKACELKTLQAQESYSLPAANYLRNKLCLLSMFQTPSQPLSTTKSATPPLYKHTTRVAFRDREHQADSSGQNSFLKLILIIPPPLVTIVNLAECNATRAEAWASKSRKDAATRELSGSSTRTRDRNLAKCAKHQFEGGSEGDAMEDEINGNLDPLHDAAGRLSGAIGREINTPNTHFNQITGK
ncbi:hypothetical protein K469DRAFT_682616 [Zopfia rhizophila CBS 207.26]|uniref:Uncharacterized protein n=1 Tax=Zopfia rhizophila CBS 207.26 TaxID=1314779 RepID=A0A6A6DB71_9PEZI|nr:hypothetical protein K469DRAFT_682616 [Zopfia rhizophila CBS 207.26]